MSQRDDFPTRLRELLAKRAGFICSNPNCRVMTIGPALARDGSVIYIGKAAHICAAAPGGPRYDAAQSTSERASIGNAIFLCAACAGIIDANGGRDHPVAMLLGWKQEHEDWVRANLNKRTAPELIVVDGEHVAEGTGEVVGLDIQGPALLQPGTRSRASGRGTVIGTRIGGRKPGDP